MRAVLTTRHGDRSALEFVEDFDEPTLDPDGVIIDVGATAVNYHDIFTRRGMPGVKIKLPVIVGSDIDGTVTQTGAKVSPDWMGKRVLIDPVFRDGKRFGMIGETCHGGRAERAAAQADQLIDIPDGVSIDQAAVLPLAYGTAWRMLVTQGELESGETILVLGASGGVGVACVQIAKMLGATVVACSSSEAKLRRLVELGADHVINYSQTPFRQAVHEVVGKPRVWGDGGVDVAVNFTGGNTMLDTQKCVRLGGRILTCGATAGYELDIDARYWWTFEQRMIGSNGWSPDDLRALLEHIADGRLDPVIDEVYSLEDTPEAERKLEDREVFGKVIIRP